MIKNMSRLLLAGAVGGAIVLGTAAGAGAASTTKNQTTVSATCANGFTGSAVIRHAMPTTKHAHPTRWFVLHVVGGAKDAKVLVPTQVDVTFTFTDSKGNVTTNTENISKKSHAGKQTTCTIDGTNTVNGGTLVASGAVTGAFH